MTTEKLLPSAFLFRFAVDCLYTDERWSAAGVELAPEYRLPSFRAELDKGPLFADLRIGWNEQGLLVWLRVTGKSKSLWCRGVRPEDSDGLSLWIDTRNMQSIHRASRFCHRFVFLPQGSGPLLDQPTASLVRIHLAKEDPHALRPGTLSVRSERRLDGYLLQAHVPAAAMTGYDPSEHPSLGFSYAVIDRELGWQTFTLGPEFPFTSDPSLWGTLDLKTTSASVLAK